MGFAEANLPNREIRSLLCLHAYLVAAPKATNVSAVKEGINELETRVNSKTHSLLDLAKETVRKTEYSDIARIMETMAFVGDIKGAQALASKIPEATIPSSEVYEAICAAEAAQG